jgi:glycosyltransferase involved in cell wall biosynthesis
MICIIISHNQKDYLKSFHETLNNCKHLFVLDRCTDGSQQFCIDNNIPYVENLVGIGRQCSRARNIGASLFPNDDILFFDGDRVPKFDITKLEQTPFDVTLVKSEIDIRDDITLNSWVHEKLWGTYHNGLFGSCVFIKRTMINKVIEKYGHLFDEDFTEWGEEDRHLGDLLFSVGATCGFADNSWRVLGRSTLCVERKKEFMNMSQLRINKLLSLNLDYLIRETIL